MANFFPVQGRWSEEDYLALTDHSNKLIELVNGRLEMLPIPTVWHRALARILFRTFDSFVEKHKLGSVHFIGLRVRGLRVRISSNTVREPDIVFLDKENMHLQDARVWQGADLAMEVVSESPKDRQRDYVDKLADYAAAGISEYWIVDYEKRVVVIHQLVDGSYQVHGEFKPGEQATSTLFEGFSIDVKALFAAADQTREEIQS